jgi:F1F0 ATPase subunit 2
MSDMGIEVNELLVALLFGGGIGLFHFGGLWYTIRRLSLARNPEYQFFFSFFLRTAISIGLFYLVSGGRWENILAAMAGFLIIRYVIVRKIGITPNSSQSRAEDNTHGY